MTDASTPDDRDDENRDDPSKEAEPLTESTDGGLDAGDPGVEE